ncbi:hypothetical protein ASF36_23395 [Methylobacterium sp. Leaf90]|nr:hypothetical protein ASF36_23395 [Methylobacterium sp. Leaf90]
MESAADPCETLPAAAPDEARRKAGRAFARHTRKSPWSMAIRVHIATAIAYELDHSPLSTDELQRRLGNDSPRQVREDVRAIRSAKRLQHISVGFDRLVNFADAVRINPLQAIAAALAAPAAGRVQ